MLVISKADAKKILADGIASGKDLRVGRFDLGKYKWSGSAKDYVGKDVPSLNGVLAVFADRGQEKDGAYAKLLCVSARG